MKRSPNVRPRATSAPGSREGHPAAASPSRRDRAFVARARPTLAWWAAGLSFAVAFVTYAHTLAFQFVWDDLILLDQKIRFYRSVVDVWFEPATLPGFRVYRPLTFGTYWLDQLIWGRNPLGFHLTSVLVHATNAALVYVLAAALGCGMWPALGGALLFAVHPVNAEAVSWIACRADLLATAFTILAVLAALAAERRRSWVWLGAVAVATFAAVASKEVGIVIPALLLALPRSVRDPSSQLAGSPSGRGPSPRSGRGAESVRPAWRWMPAAAAGAGVLVYLALRPTDRSPGLGLSAFDRDGLVHLVGTFGFYVGRVLIPVGLTAYMPSAPAGVAMIALAVLGVVAATALLLPRDRTGIRRFGTLWFLLILAPALLVAIAEMLVTKASERYLYLPSVGLALVVAAALDDALARAHTSGRTLRARRAAVAIATLTIAALALASATRASLWRDEVVLWSAVARARPALALPAMNLGLALTEAGRPDEAERAYHAALAAEGSETTKRDTAINLGHLALQRGRLDAARDYFEQANAIAPNASAYYGVGAVARSRARELLRAGDQAGAAEELTRARTALLQALAINPRHYQSHYVLGGVLYMSGDIPGAIAEYRQVVALVGDTPTGRDAAEALQQLTGAP